MIVRLHGQRLCDFVLIFKKACCTFETQLSYIHDCQAPRTEAVEDPHWAWHFLKGSEPVQVIGDETTPTSPLDLERLDFRKRPAEEHRRGRDKRQRYTAGQKLEVVEHWCFAKTNGLEMEDYLGGVSPLNAYKWSKCTDDLEEAARQQYTNKLRCRADQSFPDMRELKTQVAALVKDALKAKQRMTTMMVKRLLLKVMKAMEEIKPGRCWVQNGKMPFSLSSRWIR